MNPPVHRLLLIKPSSLGDIVHTLPTLNVLRQRFPYAAVTWLVKRQWAELIERVEGVDQICPVDEGMRGWLAQVTQLRARRFDLVIDLQGLFRSGVMAWLCGCAWRVGFANAREGSPFFYTHRVTVPTVPMHAVDRYLLVAAALGADTSAPPQFRFQQREEDSQKVVALLKKHGLHPGKPWIAMNVSARWVTKRWPAEHFARTADRLSQEGLEPVVFIGGVLEREDTRRVMRHMHTKAVDLTGQTTVGLLPSLLQKAVVLVTNDSGPMHIAAAVGTPVVALFGPTDPVRTGPYGHGHTVLTEDVPCRPCFSRHCHYTIPLACLSGVNEDRVVRAVRESRQKKAAVSTP
ncbi:MAG: lipopolysaccharide heptosyltransferase II [Nitrospiraceae bacterium]